jgi:hypothetical protein
MLQPLITHVFEVEDFERMRCCSELCIILRLLLLLLLMRWQRDCRTGCGQLPACGELAGCRCCVWRWCCSQCCVLEQCVTHGQRA